jgi:MerR HTH family regulatory protein
VTVCADVGRRGVGRGGVGRVRGGPPDRGPVRKPRDTPAHFPIRAVSKLTGLGIDTLRAWERRHGAVAPSRDDRDRMYTEADIARLRLLRGYNAYQQELVRIGGRAA